MWNPPCYSGGFFICLSTPLAINYVRGVRPRAPRGYRDRPGRLPPTQYPGSAQGTPPFDSAQDDVGGNALDEVGGVPRGFGSPVGQVPCEPDDRRQDPCDPALQGTSGIAHEARKTGLPVTVRGVRPRAPRICHAERSRSIGADEDVCRPRMLVLDIENVQRHEKDS